MKMIVTGSSSKGNGYILVDSRNHSLLLEAGVPFSDTKKALAYRVRNIEAMFITHEHGDHCKYAGEALKSMSAPIYASRGTIDSILKRNKLDRHRRLVACSSMSMIDTGSYSVIPQLLEVGKELTHDAAEPFCYQIHHPEMGTMLFVTDTYALPCTFANVQHVVIECNYSKPILDRMTREGVVDGKRRERTIQSHMELQDCIYELNNSVSIDKVLDITLIHLSDTNSDPELFQKEIEKATGKPTRIAVKNMVLNLTTPF